MSVHEALGITAAASTANNEGPSYLEDLAFKIATYEAFTHHRRGASSEEAIREHVANIEKFDRGLKVIDLLRESKSEYPTARMLLNEFKLKLAELHMFDSPSTFDERYEVLQKCRLVAAAVADGFR